MITLEQIIYVLPILALTASIFYYAVVIQNQNKTQQMQLETRQAQMFMQIYNQMNDSGFQAALKKVVPLEIHSFNEFQELFSWDSPEGLENWSSLDRLVAYYEGVGVLVREELLDVKYVALLICGMTIILWEKFSPYIDEIRRYSNSRRWASEWEYLYNELIKYLEEHPELKP